MKSERPVPWISGGLATLVALLIIAAELPNTDEIVPYVHPRGAQKFYIQPHPEIVCSVLAWTLIPVLFVFLGRRWIVFEWLGWIVLIVFLAGMFLN